MTGRRLALVVATDTYDDASLSRLRSAAADADALSKVLADPTVGGFEVDVVRDAASWEVQAHIEGLLADSRSDDLVLIHFSGHGLKSDSGELFIAARNTRPDLLASTSVPADFVQRCVRSSRAGSIVLFLDCCYGGAFGEGVAVRAAGPVNVHDSLPAERLGGGRGRAVITASSAIEYAFEGTVLTADHEIPPSVFTSAVVHGLRTGDADRDEDGLVSLDELYDYVYDRVQEQNPRQTPGRDIEMSGELYLARSGRRRVRPAPVPEALAAALAKANPVFRRGAVAELRDRLGHADLAVALGALEALQGVVKNDIRAVAQDAEAAIAAALPSVQPSALDFGEMPPDAAVAVERTLSLGGVPLARYVQTSADPPLSALVAGDTVTVTFSPTGEPFSGSVTVTNPAGSVVVPVDVAVRRVPAGMTPPALDDASEPAGATAERRLVPVSETAPVEPTAGDEQSAAAHEPRSAERAAAVRDDAVQQADRDERVPYNRWIAWALFVGATLILVGAPSWSADQASEWTAAILLGPGVRAGLAATAGLLLLAPRVSAAVARGFLVGTASIAGVGALSALQVPAAAYGTENLQTGWYLAFFGQALAAVAAAVAVVIASWRGAQPRGRIEWRSPATVVVLACAIAGALLSVLYSTTRSGDGAGMAATVDALWAAGSLVLAPLGLVTRPSEAGRALLVAWGLGVTSHGLSEWVYMTNQGELPTVVPLIAFVGMAFVVASVGVGRRSA